MKLLEIRNSEPTPEDILNGWFIDTALDENAVIGALHIASIVKSCLFDLAANIKIVYGSNNRKSEINDKIIGDRYRRDVKKLDGQIGRLPQKAQAVLRAFIAQKFGIKLSGIDLSRENGKRLLLVTLIRAIVMIAEKMSNVDELIVAVVGLLTGTGFAYKAIKILLSSKDLNEVLRGSATLVKDLVAIFQKANDDRKKNDSQRNT